MSDRPLQLQVIGKSLLTLKVQIFCLVMYNAIFFQDMAKNVRFLEVDKITIKLVFVQITDYLGIVTITDFLSSTLDLSHAP